MPHQTDRTTHKLLCRKMHMRCEEYLMVEKHPDHRKRAAEIKEEIIRLYAQICRSARRRV